MMTTSKQQQYKYLQFSDNSGYRRFIKGGEANTIQADKKVIEPALDIPAHGTYGGLLFHPQWKAKRKEILSRDKHHCVICKSEKELQVHHRQYHFIAGKSSSVFPGNIQMICSSRFVIPAIAEVITNIKFLQ